MKRALSGQSASLVKCMRPAFLQGQSIEHVDESLMKCSGIEKRATVSCAEAHVCPPACACTDTTVDCRDRGLTHIPANLPSSTTELRLEQNRITYVPPKAFQNLRNLKRLDLSRNWIIEVAPRAFQGLHSLNSLVLYGNNLTELPAEAFHGLGNLQLLLLNANQLQCIRQGTFDPLTELNLLSLYDNQISNRGLMEVPSTIPQFATELYLNKNRISTISADSGLRRLQNLVTLDLSSNNIMTIDEDSLTDMGSLRDLNLANNQLYHFSSAALGSNNILEILSLSSNRLKCISGSVFDGLKHLRTLKISGNDLPCDCQLAPLLLWMKANASRKVEAGQCVRPQEMMGRSLEEIRIDDMSCA
ncbi:hypothetical protein GCK32_013221, partial [Trichostrongylus colubriformis]